MNDTEESLKGNTKNGQTYLKWNGENEKYKIHRLKRVD